MWVNLMRFCLLTDLLRSSGCEALGSAGDSSSDPAAQGWCPLQTQVIITQLFSLRASGYERLTPGKCLETCLDMSLPSGEGE